MSDIDRVFARLGGKNPAGSDQRELRRIPRKGGSAGSRVVEVVRLPARGVAATEGGPRQPDFRVRAATWDDGFPVKAASAPCPSQQPVAAEPAVPVAHVVPTWTPTVVEPSIEPAPATPPEPARSATPPPATRTRRRARAAS